MTPMRRKVLDSGALRRRSLRALALLGAFAGAAGPAAAVPQAPPARPDTPRPAPAAAAPAAAPRATHPSVADIELLISGDAVSPAAAATAVTICRRIAADYDDRDIARFLHQYGRALAHSGDPDAGIVMLARCFILFPESRWAPAAMLDSARFHRQYFRDEAAVERLARRAAHSARAMGLRELAEQADAFLAEPAPAAHSAPSRPSPRPLPASPSP